MGNHLWNTVGLPSCYVPFYTNIHECWYYLCLSGSILNIYSIIAVFDYPKNLTLFDTECEKVLGSSLLVVRFDYGIWCATFDLP